MLRRSDCTFTADEERMGGPAAVVLSHRLWQNRFAGDPSILGRTLTLNGTSRLVIGVMPSAFRYPTAETEAWIPAPAAAAFRTNRQARFYNSVARMKAGVTLAQAQDDLARAQAALAQQFPQTDADWTVRLVPLQESIIGGVGRSLWLLFGAAIVVVLGACGNIAGLLLADAARRSQQVAVQFALGASRSIVVRQRLIEGVVLATIGSAGGLVVASWGVNAIRALAPQLPRAAELQIDMHVVAFATVAAVLSTLIFALLPALHATGRDIAARLGSRGEIGGRLRFRRGLMMGQIAFAIMLLVGAGLLIRSLAQLQRVPPGLEPQNVVAFRMSAAWSERPEAVATRQARTLERLAALPGVHSAALGQVLPAGRDADWPPAPFTIVGRPADDSYTAVIRSVSASYFATMGIPLLYGQTCRDEPGAQPSTSVVINQLFAARFFPGEDPIGKTLGGRVPMQVVGVAGNAREQSLLKEPQPAMYVCGLTPFYPDPWFIVRLDPRRAVAGDAIRAAMREIEPQRAVYFMRTMSEVLADSASQPRLNTFVFTFFGATALTLVAVGLYGLLAQVVSERTREIGVRLALGARPGQVLLDVVRQCAAITAAGVAIGLGLALALARMMTTVVYGVSARDPVTFVGVAAMVSLVALAAAFGPARRAANLDPLTALRQE